MPPNRHALRLLSPAVILLLTLWARAGHADEACMGWTKIDPVLVPPARGSHGLVYDPVRAEPVLFGGWLASMQQIPLDDTWVFNGSTWLRRFPDHIPEARAGQLMTFDSKRGVVVMGHGVNAMIHRLTDLWTWDGLDWKNILPNGAPNGPEARAEGVFVYDKARDRIVLYGGKNVGIGEDCSDALWEWDGSAWSMVPMNAASAAAAKTFGCYAGIEGYYDDARGVTTLTNGTYTVDLTSSFPQFLPPPSATFQLETEGAATYHPGLATGFLFGGHRYSCCVYDTISRRPPGAEEFQPLPVTGPSPRGLTGLAYDAPRDQLLIFGGRLVNPNSNLPLWDDETWAFHYRPPILSTSPTSANLLLCSDRSISVEPTGGGPYTYRWQKRVDGEFQDVADAAPFSGVATDTLRINPFRAMDAGDYRCVVSNPCGTTAGRTYTLAVAESFWVNGGAGPDLGGPGLAYDAGRQRLVIFGGGTYANGLHVTNGTWERVLGHWVARAVGIAPPPRTESAMAYDPVRGVTVMYGGRYFSPGGGNPTGVYGDVWEWDGTTWTQRPDGPGPRHLHAMVWDGERQRIETFGGRYNGTQQSGELWEYDGTSWTQRFPVGDPSYGPAGGPAARENFALAYDDDRKALVLHGGFLGQPSLGRQYGETWELVADHWTMKNIDPFLAKYTGSIAGFHASHHRVAMFVPSGVLGNGTTWEWHGTPPWKQLLGLSPEGRERAGAVMAYDSARRRLAMYGGLAGQYRSDEPELVYSEDVDPTCGSGGCGDGVIDAGEDCDPGSAGTVGCCEACHFAAASTVCGAGGSCDAGGQCVTATCGNGIVEGPEQCDTGTSSDACCSPDCMIDAAGACGNPCRSDRCVAGVCTPGTANASGCGTDTSVLAYLSNGSMTTPDGSATLTLDQGIGGALHYAIASGLTTSTFGVGAAGTLVVAAQFQPAGATFVPPGAAITLRWHDDDGDGQVDGLGLDERLLALFRDGTQITPTCLDDPGCDRAGNSWSFRTTSFSELAIAGTSCAGVQHGALRSSGKKLRLTAALASAIDPAVAGLRILVDADGRTAGSVALPAGTWKSNRKGTRVVAGIPGGTVQLRRGKKGTSLVVTSRGGALATVRPPLSVTILAGERCLTARFTSCATKHRGQAVSCTVAP
ncbi:MAG TPA: hypothetical protein VGR62_15035 [Candidatus Binatia bacterium]|jgi:hypothetical protein|nr:hypothetical protein [Candidatus Binatia bacterium]